MRYLSDDLSRNRGWYLNDYIYNLYRPVQKVEEQLNPPIEFDKSGNITFVLGLFPPWVENLTLSATPKAGVLVFYKCQECVRAL